MKRFSAVTVGVDLDRNFALATGRELSREGDRGAASPGFDLFDLKLRRPCIPDDIFMANFHPVHDRLELVPGRGEFGHRKAFPGFNDFNPGVFDRPFLGSFFNEGPCTAESHGTDTAGLNPLGNEPVEYGLRPLTRKIQVLVRFTGGIDMALDGNPQ